MHDILYSRMGIYMQRILPFNSVIEHLIKLAFFKNFKVSCSSRTCTPSVPQGNQSAQTLHYMYAFLGVKRRVYFNLHCIESTSNGESQPRIRNMYHSYYSYLV